MKELAGEELRYIILIIYDITDNKHRLKVSKLLERYGTRVQLSAFEANLTKKQYVKLLREIEGILKPDDNIRIYKLRGYDEIKVYGSKNYEQEDVIII